MAEADVDEETAWIESLHANTSEVRAADPKLARFGAAHHKYALRPPIGEAGCVAVEARIGCELPFDLRAFVKRFSSGGIGPYYGMLPIEHAPIIPAPDGAPWQRSLAIIHAGCGYMLVMPLDGAKAGQVWMHADDLGRYYGVTSSFSELFAGWMVFMLKGEWLPAGVPEGECALPNALTSYFHAIEDKLGLDEDSLAGDALHDALAELGPGAIEIGADASPLFESGEHIDPCQTCAQLIDAFAPQGLRRDVVAPGVPPLPER